MKLWLVTNTVPNKDLNPGSSRGQRGHTLFKFHAIGATEEEAISRVRQDRRPLGVWTAVEEIDGWAGGLR